MAQGRLLLFPSFGCKSFQFDGANYEAAKLLELLHLVPDFGKIAGWIMAKQTAVASEYDQEDEGGDEDGCDECEQHLGIQRMEAYLVVLRI